MEKPTVEEIKRLLPKCEDNYKTVFDKFEKDQAFYELEFKSQLNLPQEFANQGMVLPTSRDMVDSFVDHIDVSNARVYVNQKGTSNISEEEAEMMRKFGLGLIHMTNVESSISPWRVGAKHYALHGLTVFKTVWDADRWPDKPIRKVKESEEAYEERIAKWTQETHQSLPIVIQAINPHNVMGDPSYGGRLFVFEKHRKLKMDVSKRWPHWTNPDGKEIDEEVEFVSYWDDTYRCDLADGQPVLKVKGGVAKHNYGFIPYVFIDSGLGNLAYDNKPEMRYVGMLRYMYDLLVSESRNYSMSDIILAKTAWPWGYLTGENAKKVKKINQGFGTYEVWDEGVELHQVTPEVPPDALNLHLARTSDYISAHAAPRSVRGLSESGVRSGADRRTIISEASARYQYSKDSFRNGTAKVLTNCALLMKNVIPGSIKLRARTPADGDIDVEIKKEKMKEPFTFYVEFAPISEEDEYRRHDDLERMVASGLITKRTARKQMSNINPIAEEAEEERELVKNFPLVLQIEEQYAAGKMAAAISKRGGAEALVEAGGAEGLMESLTEAGRRMVPPIPEKAQPGSAEASQNQLKGLRSQTPMSPTQGRGGGGFRP